MPFFRARLHRVLGAAALSASCLVSVAARADAESDAKDLFARGRELRARHECGDAVVVFRKAYAIFPTALGSLRNLAECEEELRHPATARRAWLDLKRAVATTPEAKYQAWEADAQAAAARLAPLVARLTIDVLAVTQGREAANPDLDGLSVRVNDEPLAVALVGTELERDPGSCTLKAERRRDGATAVVSIVLGQGEARRVTLRLASEGTPASRGSEPKDPNAARRLGGVVALGVGAAALVGAGISLAVRQSALSDLNAACPNRSACSQGSSSTLDRGRVASTLVNILGSVAIVATGAGVALVLSSPPPSQPKAGFTLRPAIGSVRGVVAEWSLP